MKPTEKVLEKQKTVREEKSIRAHTVKRVPNTAGISTTKKHKPRAVLTQKEILKLSIIQRIKKLMGNNSDSVSQHGNYNPEYQ